MLQLVKAIFVGNAYLQKTSPSGAAPITALATVSLSVSALDTYVT